MRNVVALGQAAVGEGSSGGRSWLVELVTAVTMPTVPTVGTVFGPTWGAGGAVGCRGVPWGAVGCRGGRSTTVRRAAAPWSQP